MSGVYYDNADCYIFLESATLTWGDYDINIKAGSIVECVYMDHLIIYGLNQKIQYYDTSSNMNIMAEFKNGKRVNIATDRFYQQNGNWRLLYMPLDCLKEW